MRLQRVKHIGGPGRLKLCAGRVLWCVSGSGRGGGGTRLKGRRIITPIIIGCVGMILGLWRTGLLSGGLNSGSIGRDIAASRMSRLAGRRMIRYIAAGLRCSSVRGSGSVFILANLRRGNAGGLGIGRILIHRKARNKPKYTLNYNIFKAISF